MSVRLIMHACDRSAREALSREGYLVRTVRSGEELIRTVREDPPELVIIDVTNSAGLALTRDIRSCSVIPVVALSSSAGIATEILSLEAGADDYLSTPFDTRELVARIRATLRRRCARASKLGTDGG